MRILDITAVSDRDAQKNAAGILNVDENKIDVRLLKKGQSGFLGLGSKEPSLYSVVAIKGETPVDAVITGIILTIAQKIGYKIEIEGIEKNEDDKIYVRMLSDKAGYIIGKRGKTLESMQFLVNLLTQQFSDVPPKILLDIENYRDRRAQYLSDMAIKIADTVIKNGRSRLLEPLNPYERRLIHMALQEDDRVETESEGVGVYKRVRIKLRNSSTNEQQPADETEIKLDDGMDYQITSEDDSQDAMLNDDDDHDSDDVQEENFNR